MTTPVIGLCPTNRTYAFQREFRKAGINPILFDLEDVTFDVEDGPRINRGLVNNFQEFDCIVSRRFAAQQNLEHVAFFMDVYLRLENKGVEFINSPRGHLICVDKLETLVQLRNQGIKTPRTIALPTYEIEVCTKYFHELGEDVLFKPLFGAKGREIIRIQDETTLLAVIQMLERQQRIVLLEEFIKSDASTERGVYEDIRLFVAKDEVIGSMIRQSRSWITNLAKEGIPIPFKADSNLQELALRCCEACQLFYGGVDVLMRGGEPYVIEVNSFPGWDGLQRAIKRNVPARIVSKILEHLRL
ncbi:MAG: RimK family alpha-L-glutamate ligase [Candidatus Heimdallarchaeota archaeon]